MEALLLDEHSLIIVMPTDAATVALCAVPLVTSQSRQAELICSKLIRGHQRSSNSALNRSASCVSFRCNVAALASADGERNTASGSDLHAFRAVTDRTSGATLIPHNCWCLPYNFTALTSAPSYEASSPDTRDALSSLTRPRVLSQHSLILEFLCTTSQHLQALVPEHVQQEVHYTARKQLVRSSKCLVRIFPL